MILDPDNKYIRAINTYAPLAGTTILEIGCGSGRMTGDLAEHAEHVVATDIDSSALEQAQRQISAKNVDFLLSDDGFPRLKKGVFDLVIYTLSLHHVPINKMAANLEHTGQLLKKSGKIVVVEPGNGGSFLEVKKRFGAGSGDEDAEKAAAKRAMENLTDWILSPTHSFAVDFLFSNAADFYASKLPTYRKLPVEEQAALAEFLSRHTTDRGIILTSERYLNLLSR
jgi:ubiquinone/menaquinone biosynthesis C-methylase UbiE